MSGEAGCFLATVVLLIVGFFASIYMVLLVAI